jgi:hypothetical protein
MALDDRPQPPVETAAQRHARDLTQRRGDWQLDGSGNLVYVAPGTLGGRNNREFDRRGGDHYYTYDVNGNPVDNYDANGRNDRLYVDRKTGNSAITGGQHDQLDALDVDDYIGPDV